MTLKQLSLEKGVKLDSLKRALRRKGLGPYQIGETLPEEALEALAAKEVNQSKPPKQVNGSEVSFKRKLEPKDKHSFYEQALPLLPLPMLGLAASYGVYFFAAQFVPTWVAIAEAAAFELTYIGLAMTRGLTDAQRKRADRVSIGAVAVSVIYNTLAGALHQEPGIFEGLSLVWFWVLSIIHGAPLAILAYYVANLLLHRK